MIQDDMLRPNPSEEECNASGPVSMLEALRRGAGFSQGDFGERSPLCARSSLDRLRGGLMEPLLSAAEVARIVGISRVRLYQLAARGDIATVRMVGTVRFRPADVEAFKAAREGRRA
jgi:excisionase family DNA binding protein